MAENNESQRVVPEKVPEKQSQRVSENKKQSQRCPYRKQEEDTRLEQ